MGESIDICVNGEPRSIAAGSSVAMLLAEHGLHPQRVAVEVNERLVRRADFDAAVLCPRDRIEIVTLVGGG
ncbi:MAG: sulfur carrier protein ThiS [Phycisphaerales bacterium]|nr:sulfur carrier protein ThiS [Phycisphaerales bacterium]